MESTMTVNDETHLETYLRIRAKDIGIAQWWPFIMMIAHKPEETPDPIPKDISQNITLFVLIQNDIYRFEQKWSANLLALIQHQNPDWSFEKILDFVEETYWKPCINKLRYYFVSYKENHALLNSFINIMDGFDKWYSETNRYRSKTSPFVEFLE